MLAPQRKSLGLGGGAMEMGHEEGEEEVMGRGVGSGGGEVMKQG